MVGVEEGERLTTPILRSLRSRHPWLQINLLTCFVAAAVVGAFEGTLERIRRTAALVVEDTMLDMAEIVSDPKSTATARVSAFSEIRELAGLTSKGAIGGVGAAGGGPLVVINMGDSPKDRVIIGGTIE
jgi:hypothetical protein